MDALPQFRQSATGVLGRLNEEASRRQALLEEKTKGMSSIDQLKNLAATQEITAKTELGQNISMGGIELHSIYGAFKNNKVLKQIADARDKFRKQYEKKGEEKMDETEKVVEEIDGSDDILDLSLPED